MLASNLALKVSIEIASKFKTKLICAVVCYFKISFSLDMRDTNENMIELLDVSRGNGIYSSLIKHKICGEDLKIRFSIDSADYIHLRNILDFRPYENTGVAKYHYYFALSYRKDSENIDLAYMNVRVEQADRHKQYEFKVSKKYISNILWFDSLTDKKYIEAMIEK